MAGKQDFYTFPRAKILSVLKGKKDLTIESLSTETKISRGSLSHHLNILKARGLITISKPHKDKKGQPVCINLTKKASPIQKEMLDIFEKLSKVFKK